MSLLSAEIAFPGPGGGGGRGGGGGGESLDGTEGGLYVAGKRMCDGGSCFCLCFQQGVAPSSPLLHLLAFATTASFSPKYGLASCHSNRAPVIVQWERFKLYGVDYIPNQTT
ncbi:unnamed protein product [Pleuronectes platessa]|uniref:Uncharacterized protein n=1 Tax=Pleuronectes platessa TaxID=8262 RepID=A0A9N7VWP5_PLEPL|nr:unnamed protein product [Pleuronectes platessa]